VLATFLPGSSGGPSALPPAESRGGGTKTTSLVVPPGTLLYVGFFDDLSEFHWQLLVAIALIKTARTVGGGPTGPPCGGLDENSNGIALLRDDPSCA
jgi:hypothetical protein